MKRIVLTLFYFVVLLLVLGFIIGFAAALVWVSMKYGPLACLGLLTGLFLLSAAWRIAGDGGMGY